jgi:ribosomal-protein-alanine N-acetyltransferase
MAEKTFPELETERLSLRRVDQQDAGELFALYSIPEVVQFINLEPLQRVDQAKALITAFETLFESGKGLRWGVFTLDSGHLIGTCGFKEWDPRRFRAEISYDLAPASWGSGYMREALVAVLDYGFHHMQLRRVEGMVDPRDTRSHNLLSGLGFRMEGILREHDFIKGEFQDDMVFALLHQDWAEDSTGSSSKG